MLESLRGEDDGGGKVLCPTPGRGSEVWMNSYEVDVVAEKLRTTAGSVDMLNLEAIGLKLLKLFILDQ